MTSNMAESPKGLDEKTRKELEAKYPDGFSMPEEDSLPDEAFISQATTDKLMEQFGMNIDHTTRQVVWGITGEYIPPYTTGKEMAEEYLELFKPEDPSDEGLLHQIGSWLDRSYTGDSKSANKDGASVGMAVVLKAFHLEKGPEFIDRMRSVPMEEFVFAFEDFGSAKNKTTLIDRVNSAKKIPLTQPFLRGFTERFFDEVPMARSGAVRDGAEVMFHVINSSWRAIYPPEQSPKS